MHLPAAIRTYFAARAPQDSDALAAAFTPDAVVQDEGRSHRGPQAIREWWLAANARYRHETEPLHMTEADGKSVVRANVAGNFPGSPAVLTFTFALDGQRITRLEIG